MLRWICRLVDVERVENMIDYRHLQIVDLEPVVRCCASQMQSTAEAKNIRIEVKCDVGACRAWADTDCVTHILANLLSNAIKFSPPGETVSIALSNGRPRCRIVVHNHGSVIPADDRQHLFEKFSRLRPQPTRGEPSHGVGLFLTQRLTRALQGQIHCSSSAAKGTSFIIDLPTA
jgi:signal transduction histidine kinase